MEFTHDDAKRLIGMDKQLTFIIDKLNSMEIKIDKSLTDHECRIRDVEIHGSQKTKEVEVRITELCVEVDKVKETVAYERGRLAIIFIAIGSLISAAISFWVSRT